MTGLLDRELLFVTGKGGAGKTTVALAAALAAAERGRRVVLCEVAGQARAARLLGRAPAPAGREAQVADGLWVTTVEPHLALEEWAARQLRSRRLVHPLVAARAFRELVDAAPGVRELVTMAKAWELGRAERWRRDAAGYDLVVVDGPASGHALGMLRAPRTFAEIARVGPIAAQARRVVELLEDPRRSGIVAVARAAELAVAEALDLEARVPAALRRRLDLVVVNGLAPRRFSARDVAALARADGVIAPAVTAAVRAQVALVAAEQAQLRRLRRRARAAVITLPAGADAGALSARVGASFDPQPIQ